ncbi:hypothetical protein [Streptomyces sp. NBC_00365]|uniref:hypothetical protein n=1 Tax=Streptomyces sp. NBC_00365 TaxID=2975726 RepID=UPI002B1D2D7A|nr:hypothetical protein [Streptomyces sp. NBC_00365]
MEIFHRPPTAKGPAATFTGDVWVAGIYADAAPDRARPAVVRFAPGARSHWHAHRLRQTLHIVGASPCWAAATARSSRPAPAAPSVPRRARSTGTAPPPTAS